MALTKLINGKRVPLSDAEEAAVRAEWEANAAAPAPVPAAVTPAQARLALEAAGLLATVEAMVDSLGPSARTRWDYGITVPRNDPLIALAAQQLNLTDAQMDDLFRAAAKL